MVSGTNLHLLYFKYKQKLLYTWWFFNDIKRYFIIQKDAYDAGHVAKVSYVYDILIFGFKLEECGQNVRFSIIGENTKENIWEIPFWFYICSHF